MHTVRNRCQPRNSAKGSTEVITRQLQQRISAIRGFPIGFHILPKFFVLQLASDGGRRVFLQIVTSPQSLR